MKKIVLTGGGTAGHVTPNIALMPELKKRGYDISYIGSYEGMEKGMEKGEKKGEKKGIEKGIKITKMILSGKSDEEIMESMELTGEELEKLKKKLEEY